MGFHRQISPTIIHYIMILLKIPPIKRMGNSSQLFTYTNIFAINRISVSYKSASSIGSIFINSLPFITITGRKRDLPYHTIIIQYHTHIFSPHSTISDTKCQFHRFLDYRLFNVQKYENNMENDIFPPESCLLRPRTHHHKCTSHPCSTVATEQKADGRVKGGGGTEGEKKGEEEVKALQLPD